MASLNASIGEVSGRAGYVLVGGRSSRFGRDKALVDVNGRPLARHVADIVSRVTGDVFLVGDPDRYESLGLPVIPDQVRSFGPVAGISAALNHTSAEWNLIVACDMPNLRAPFLEQLFRRAEISKAPAVVPLQPDGREQPLCAVYSSQMRDVMNDAVQRGIRRVVDAISSLGVRLMLPPEYADIDPSGEIFANANTPDELRRAVGRR